MRPTDVWRTCLWKKSLLTLSRSSSTLLWCELIFFHPIFTEWSLMGRWFTYKSSYISKREKIDFWPQFEIILWHLKKKKNSYFPPEASSDGGSVHAEHSRHVLWGLDNAEMSSSPFQKRFRICAERQVLQMLWPCGLFTASGWNLSVPNGLNPDGVEVPLVDLHRQT